MIKPKSSSMLQLLPYQEIGYQWLLKHIINKQGCILADDMGLGKTLQIIATILHFKNNNYIHNRNKVLIVVPLGLILNWVTEFTKFAPSIKIHVYHDKINNGKRNITKDCDIILTAYSLLVKDFKNFDREWLFIIIDEAQRIKNPETKIAKAIKSIKALHKIAITGTPFENNLSIM